MLIQVHVYLGHALTQVERVLDITLWLVKNLEFFGNQVEPIVSLVEQISLEEAQLLTCFVKPAFAEASGRDYRLGKLAFSGCFAIDSACCIVGNLRG